MFIVVFQTEERVRVSICDDEAEVWTEAKKLFFDEFRIEKEYSEIKELECDQPFVNQYGAFAVDIFFGKPGMEAVKV